ncbi:MAG: haloacid dehalogenase type II [Gaiellaceae bacterium]
MSSIDVAGVEALTFDCYGTLVDWESGILATLRPMLQSHGIERTDGELLESFGKLESRIQATAFGSYRSVLEAVTSMMASQLGFAPSEDERTALPDELGTWPVFPDTREALTRLATRFKLAIVSNVDDELFAQTQDAIGVGFDEVVTAEQVRSYKPERAHFDEVLRRLGLDQAQVIHVAQSLFHDIAPATALGLQTIWVRRGASLAGGGATPRANAWPDHVVDDLAAAADLLVGA